MVNEEKVKIMNRLAMYEHGEGRKYLPVSRYYRSDYIGLALIRNFFLVTIGYILGLAGVAAYFSEYLMDNVNKINLVEVGIYIIVGYLICIFQVLTPLYGIKFFLRSCASYLLYQMLIPWDPRKNTEPFCQICCLVKTSHPFFSGMQRNGNDQIRLPPFQIFFSEDAHCLCIKIPIFPTSVILKSYQRLSPDLSVPENTSALRKMMGTLAAIFTVFLFHFYRSSAFHTPGTGYRPDLSGTLRTDQPVFFFQYLMTQRAFFRVKHVQ